MKQPVPRYAFDTYGAFLVCMLVGALRLLMEWGVGGTYLLFPASDVALAFGYYWLAACVFARVLGTALGEPWRGTFPIALAAVALDLLPPVIDGLAGGGPVRYGYFFDFPSGFGWGLYGPAAGVTPGQCAAWWLTIAFLAGYAGVRTRSAARAAAAAALAYGAAVVLLGVLPTASALVRAAWGWPGGHQRAVFVLLLAAGSLAAYAALAPAVAAGLLRRTPHAFPFVAICFAGSAFAGGVSVSTFVYAALLLFAFVTALAHNDLYDTAEDERQGRRAYLDREDARFLTLTLGLAISVPAVAGSLTTVPLVVVLVISILYSFPFYRGKRYFPANLKMEGMWGLSSFTLGVTAAIEQRAFGAPRWWLAGLPDAAEPGLLRAFDGTTLAAMVLVLGGYSLVAVLKDYKDWEADLSAGIQTVYTLAARRGASLERVHGAAVGASAAALAAAPLLLAWAGLTPWAAAACGPVAAAALWALMGGKPSSRAFTHTLYLLTAYFAFLAVALSA